MITLYRIADVPFNRENPLYAELIGRFYSVAPAYAVNELVDVEIVVPDTRSLADLAKQAIDIQNACNLSGLVFGWAKAMARLNTLLPNLSTDERNTHPINRLWADKCRDLSGYEGWSEAYSECERIAKGG